MMGRSGGQADGIIQALLLICVIISAVGVVYSMHISRLHVGTLSALTREQDSLQMEWEKLLVEINMLTAYSHVEKTAKSKLDMKVPGESDLRVLDLRGRQ